MFCPKCGKENKEEAKFCIHCGGDIFISSGPENRESQIKLNHTEVIQALKTPNTCCLWVSLDYWNLYMSTDRAIAVRLYRGWWGLIGAIIGLFLYIIGDIITTALGILLDRSIGGGKCHIMRDRLEDILSNRNKYKIIDVPLNQVKKIQTSDLCLGNLWLKYMIEVGGKKLYFENSKYDQLEKITK
jgi:hypothetical protein